MEKEEWLRCIKAIEQNDAEYIVASGSLSPGVPVDIYSRLAKVAKREN